jgi:hypothetical protein
MPSAVPYQQGLIGQYNNSTSPGVYVSWDPNTNFASTQSLVFKGIEKTNFQFPLIVDTYVSSNVSYNIDTPKCLACSTAYYYVVTSTKLIIYYKQGDRLTTKYTVNIVSIPNLPGLPDTILVKTYGGVDYLFFARAASAEVRYYTFNGTTLTHVAAITYDNITGLSTTYNDSYLALDDNNFYLTKSGNVYACAYTSAFTLNTADRAVIISSTNGIVSGNTLSYIANFDNSKIAVVDNQDYIYELIFEGNISSGNSSSNWSLNFKLEPTNETWSSIIYNHFGIIVALDSTNHTINAIASSATVDDGTSGFISSGAPAQSSNETGKIVNSKGGIGVGYLQFNTPSSVAEDSEFNLIIADLNNRITYFNTELDFVATVNAPLNELIDSSGNPAETYYIKQTNDDYSQIFSIPPVIGEELLLKSSVLYELNALLRVPVYDEEPLFGYARKSATLAYGDIVTDPAPQVRVTCATNNGQNSSMFVVSPFVAFKNSLDQSDSDPFSAPTNNDNYPNGLYYRFTNEGKLYFYDSNGDPASVKEYDTILVSYYVKMFTNRQINNALYLALQAINAQPGLNKISNVASTPYWYDQTLVSGATYYLLRQLIVGLNQRERRLLVMDPDQNAFDAVSNLKESAKMYQEEFNELLKKLPLAVRPLMGTITTPEFAIPGGRSRLFRALWTTSA